MYVSHDMNACLIEVGMCSWKSTGARCPWASMQNILTSNICTV